MTDETKNESAELPIDVAAVVVGDEYGIQAEAAIAVQGTAAVLVARFADTDTAKMAYDTLRDAEARGSIDIDGVLVANADEQGKVHIQKMTDHTTRKGFAWGAVGGAVIGLIFPPSILAGAAAVGIAGAVIGKAGNVLKKSKVADELVTVITPGTSGIVALVDINAVEAVTKTIPQASEVKAVPVDDETAEALKQAAKAAGDPSAA
jgi:uncharacterized membrane protein